MKQFLKKRWVVPIGALVLTLAIGSAAFAATGASSTSTAETSTTDSTDQNDAAESQKGLHGFGAGGQRGDETPLTGDELSKAQAAALAVPEVGSDATVVRAETDADSNGKYEVHLTKADGTMVTVYLDESFNVVKTEEGHAGGRHGGGLRERDGDCDGTGAPSTDSAPTTSS